MLGSGSARRCASATTALATASRGESGACSAMTWSSSRARGSPDLYTKWPKPGIRSPRRSSSPTTRGASAGPAGRRQHDLGAERGAAVQGAADGAQAGGHDRVRVGAHRGGHPGGQRGGGQLVVGQQHQRRAAARPARPGARLGPAHSRPAPAARRSSPPSSGPPASGLSPRRAGPAAPVPGGRQSAIPAISARPAAITAGRSRCRRSGSVAARAGTMTWSRSSGRVAAGSAAWAAAPAASAACARGHARPGPGRPAPASPVHSSSATSSKRAGRPARWRPGRGSAAASPVISVSADSMISSGAGRAARGGPCGPAGRSRRRRTGCARPPASRRRPARRG